MRLLSIGSIILLFYVVACGPQNQSTPAASSVSNATGQKMTVSLTSPQMNSLFKITRPPNSAVTLNAVISGSTGTLSYIWQLSAGAIVSGCGVTSPTCVVQYNGSVPVNPYSVSVMVRDSSGATGTAIQYVTISTLAASNNSANREIASIKSIPKETTTYLLYVGLAAVVGGLGIWFLRSKRKI